MKSLLSATILLVLATPAVGRAQWLNYPTPGIPRLANGAPNLKAPAPRTTRRQAGFFRHVVRQCPVEGLLPDRRTASRKSAWRASRSTWASQLKDGLPYTDWSKEQMKVRRANGGREDPHTYCMPPNFPRAWTLPQHIRGSCRRRA